MNWQPNSQIQIIIQMQNSQSNQLQRSSMKERFDQFSNQSSIMKKTANDPDNDHKNRPSVGSLMSPNPYSNQNDDLNDAKQFSNFSAKQSNKIPSGKQSEKRKGSQHSPSDIRSNGGKSNDDVQNSKQIDPNEFSGIMSSPGLCGNNSLLGGQDDVMNDFMKNLKRKMDESQDDDQGKMKFDEMQASNLSSKMGPTQYKVNSIQGSQTQVNKAVQPNILQQSGVDPGLKQSQFSDEENQKNFENMSQLGQFAQLSCLYNNLSQKPASQQNQAFENFKNDKSLLKHLEQNNLNPQNLNAEQFLSQLSQFGFDAKKAAENQDNFNLEELEFSDKTNMLKQSSIFKASSNITSNHQKPPTSGGEMSFQNELELKSLQQKSDMILHKSSLGSKNTDKYSKIMKKLTNSLQSNSQKKPKDEELNLAEMASSLGKGQETEDRAAVSQLKQSQLFSNKKEQKDKDRFNRWLNENDTKEDRLRSYDPESSTKKKNQESKHDVKNQLKSLSTNSLNQKFQSLQKSRQSSQKSQEEIQKEEDIRFYQNNMRLSLHSLGSAGSGYKTQPKKEKSPKQQINDFINEPSSEKNDGEIFSTMQGLIVEKERLNQEQQKIRENKFLKMVDRSNAIKSVRSLSRTIDELLSKEKEKISEHYQSKMSQLSKSKASDLKESRILGNLSSEKNENEEQLKESFLKVSNLTKTKGNNLHTPGGTTDSLQFSQSIALSNLAATIKTGSKGQTQSKNQTNPRSQRDDQKGEIQFDDIKDNTDPRSQFIFSEISNLKDQIHEDNYNGQIEDSDLERQKSNKDSYPPRMSQQKFEEDLMASITKRGQTQMDSEEIEFQANRMSQQNSMRDFEPQSQNFMHKEGALQFPEEQIYSQTQNKDIEILQLHKEKDAMQLINDQLEAKLALKDKQMQIYLRQIELKAQSQEKLQNESNHQLQQLEKELEELHQDEINQLKKQHMEEIQQMSRQMEGGSQDPIVAMQLEQLSQENQQLKQEIDYHKEVSERYQILQRSFDQMEMAKLKSEKAESKFDEDSKIEEKVEERLRPLIDEFHSKNKALKQERDEMAHQIQKVKQSTILEIQNSRHESDLQIQQMNLQLEQQQIEHEKKKKEIAKLQALVEASNTDRSDRNFDEIQKQMQGQVKENTQLYQKIDKLKSQSSQKDTLIKQLQESIQQLETGLSQISEEAQSVVSKNIQYKKDIEKYKKQIQQLQTEAEKSKLTRSDHEETRLMQSQHIKNQQMIQQLQETVGAQKELIRQMEQQSQEMNQKIIDQTFENQQMSLKIKEQQSLIQNSQETQNSIKMAEKAQSNMSSLEKDNFLKQIEHLKLLESKSKKKSTQMQGQINEQLKEISQVNQKYAKQLEITNEMKQQLEIQLGELTSTKLQASEMKLGLQKKTQEYNQLKQKLEAHKQRQIDDLKESISLKITCADDIQALLKQQKIELQDTKASQREQEEKSKQQIEEIRQKANAEREQMLQKLWSSQNEVKQLSVVNREMLDEIESVKSTLKLTSRSRSPSPLKNSKGQVKGQRRKRSKSKSSQMNPMLSHLDQLKSTYQSKVSKITGNQSLNIYSDEYEKPKDFSFDDQNKNQINLKSTHQEQESDKDHDFRSNTFSSQKDKSELKVQQLLGNANSNNKDLETINSKNENRFIRVDEKHDSHLDLGARRPSFGSQSSSENGNKSSQLHSRIQGFDREESMKDSLPKAVHSGRQSQDDDSFETFRDKAHFGNLQASSDSFQTKQQTSEKKEKMRMNTESMEDIFRQFKVEQDKIINEGLKSNFKDDEDQDLDQKPTSQKNSEQLPMEDLDNIDVFDQWVQSISQK